jgi:uncharacterized protein (TIGR00251 family)
MSQTQLKVLVTPRSSKNRLLGYCGDVLKVSLTAPPVEGAANAALVKFLAPLLGKKPKDLSIGSGQASRHKTIIIDGLELMEVKNRLLKHLPEQSQSRTEEA